MAVFKGSVSIAGCDTQLTVDRGVNRTRVCAGAATVLDAKPFIAKSEFAAVIAGERVVIRFKPLGFGEECFIEVQGAATRLAAADARGRATPEPSRLGREKIAARMAGLGFLGAIPVCLIAGWPSSSGWYKPVLLGAPPLLFVVGLVALVCGLLPEERLSALQVALKSKQWWVPWLSVAALCGIVGLMWLGGPFTDWILAIASR